MNKYLNITLEKLTPAVVALIISSLMIARVIYFYNMPDSSLIGVIPDDAFYYMQMAKHRVIEGFWTFDGTSPATGFHFLYGYLLVFIYSVYFEIDWHLLYIIIGVMSSIFIGLASFLTAQTAKGIFGYKSIVFSMIPFLAATSLIQSTAMMESWLVLFFSSATIYYLVSSDIKNKNYIIPIFLGVFGSLSRSDYGLLPGVMFISYFLTSFFVKNNKVKDSFFVLIGSVIGVAIVLTHNFHISGNFLQASAQTKLYWSSILGHNIFPPLILIISLSIPYYELLNKSAKFAIVIAALFMIISYFIKSKKYYYIDVDKLLVGSMCLLTLIFYGLFYRLNSQALQSWYSSNLIAPIALLGSFLGYFLIMAEKSPAACSAPLGTVSGIPIPRPLGRGSLLNQRNLIVPLVIFLICISNSVINISFVPWPHQAGMMNAGLFLKDQNLNSKYASWNAGIISYFSGKNVINIDGLTNDDILPFIKNNNLFDYIKLNEIEFIVDYSEMLSNKSARLRGGYLDDRIDRCLMPIKVVDGDAKTVGGPTSRLMLFQVVDPCN